MNLENLFKSETVLVSPQMAREIRATMPFERQRPIKMDHVKRLAQEMKNGWFLPGTPIWICVLPDGTECLVNGHHTMEAISMADTSVALTIIRQRVKDMEQASWSYACFDIQRSRTWEQAGQALGLTDKLPWAGRVFSAIRYIQSGFVKSAGQTEFVVASRHARFDAAKDYMAAVQRLHALAQGTGPAATNILLRAGTFAVAIATMKYQPSSAEEFWGGLLRDDGLRVGDPRRTLLRYLQNNTARAAQFNIPAASALAWNAYFEGRQITKLKPGASDQILILGTPWAKPRKEAKTKTVVNVASSGKKSYKQVEARI